MIFQEIHQEKKVRSFDGILHLVGGTNLAVCLVVQWKLIFFLTETIQTLLLLLYLSVKIECWNSLDFLNCYQEVGRWNLKGVRLISIPLKCDNKGLLKIVIQAIRHSKFWIGYNMIVFSRKQIIKLKALTYYLNCRVLNHWISTRAKRSAKILSFLIWKQFVIVVILPSDVEPCIFQTPVSKIYLTLWLRL